MYNLLTKPSTCTCTLINLSDIPPENNDVVLMPYISIVMEGMGVFKAWFILPANAKSQCEFHALQILRSQICNN